MEFSAIEVPGEANPLTEGILFHVLRSASSSDPTQIQTGTKQLQEWEKARGFYPLLQACHILQSTWALTDILPVGLLRQVPSNRSPLPGHYSTQERYRQVLAKDCHQVGPPVSHRDLD
jgi:hypothetical protein